MTGTPDASRTGQPKQGAPSGLMSASGHSRRTFRNIQHSPALSSAIRGKPHPALCATMDQRFFGYGPIQQSFYRLP